MRFNMILFILIGFLCATAAFAAETPSGFEGQGHYLPPSQCDVKLTHDREHLVLTNSQTSVVSIQGASIHGSLAS